MSVKAHLLDLLSQFSSGGQNQGLALIQLNVNLLEQRDGKGGSLAGTRLSLSNHIMPHDAGQNGTLLDGRWTLKTIGIDTTKQLLLQLHLIKVVNNLLKVKRKMLIQLGQPLGLDSLALSQLDSMTPSGSIPGGPS